MTEAGLGGRFTFPGTSVTVATDRLRRDAAGRPRRVGPPRNPNGAIAVLRAAVERA